MRKGISPELQKNLDRIQWTGNELLKAKLPTPEWVIPNYLPFGLTVLAGRPFAGKSFLALQVASALRSGGMFFDQKVKQGRCLYIAKEDINASIRDRMTGQRWTQVPSQFDVDIFTGWKRFKQGGMDDLKKQLESKEYTICILDSLYKFLTGSKNEKDGEMEPVMSTLQDFYKKGLVDSMFVLAHTNKMSVQAGDGDESAVSGDTSLMGVADNLWLMQQRQGSSQMHFYAQGRVMSKIHKEVLFDKTSLSWQLTRPKDKIKTDSVRGLILSKLTEQARPLSATVLAELTGKPTPLIHRELKILEMEMLVQREPRHGLEVLYTLKTVDFLQ